MAAYQAEDYATALALFEQLAQRDHVEAQYNTGVLYYHGHGTAADPAKALYWFQRAAGWGHRESQYNCGVLYKAGQGTAPDLAAARSWFEKAAAQGHQGAQKALAALDAPAPQEEDPAALFRQGVEAYDAGDYETALSLFEEGAAQGDPQAQYNCAIMYDNGQGAMEDKSTALYWYEQAAQQGHADAQHNCGGHQKFIFSDHLMYLRYKYRYGERTPHISMKSETYCDRTVNLIHKAVIKLTHALFEPFFVDRSYLF